MSETIKGMLFGAACVAFGVVIGHFCSEASKAYEKANDAAIEDEIKRRVAEAEKKSKEPKPADPTPAEPTTVQEEPVKTTPTTPKATAKATPAKPAPADDIQG